MYEGGPFGGREGGEGGGKAGELSKRVGGEERRFWGWRCAEY